MKTILILNGEILDYKFIKSFTDEEDYIIACDGGLKHCKVLDIIPNLILGDFDSVNSSLLDEFKSNSEVLKFPKDKDFTDGELGVQKAIEIGNEVIILGGFSYKGRIDHVFSNVFMMKSFSDNGIKAKMISENNEIYYLDDELEFECNKKFVSLIPLSEIVEVEKSKGLKYDLTNQIFNFGSSRSLSNESIEKSIYIKLIKGKALVTVSCD